MVDDPGKRWLIAGNYAQMKTQMMLLKNRQNNTSEDDGMPSIISKSGGVKRNDKVCLFFYFLEERPKPAKDQVIVSKTRKASGTIGMRLMEFKSPTRKNEILYTREQFVPLAEKVRKQLATPPVIWQKGKKLYSYSDWERGLQFQVLSTDVASAQIVINACLDVRGYTFDSEYFNLVENKSEASRYPDSSDSINLLGKKTYFPKERPIVAVTFQWAKLYFPTIDESFLLYSRSKKALKQNPIIPA